MFTYTGARTLLGTLTGDSSSANLTNLDTLHNEGIKKVITTKPWPFRQKTWTRSTETDNVHQLPGDCGKVLNVTVTIGTTKYTPKRVKSREEWDRLNQSTAVSSNTPEYYFIFGKTYSFFPKPSSATTDAITISGEREVKDLSVADYTAGTIVSIANGATTVTGSSTVWTAQMAGRYIRITDSNTANTGDGYWYEISSVTSATVLELVAPYNGTSIAAGSAAYTLGQASIIPEDYQMVPLNWALQYYFQYILPDADRAALAKNDYIDGIRSMNIGLGSPA